MLTKVEITIKGEGSIPGDVEAVIADMIRDYLIEQGIFEPDPIQTELFD